MRYDSALWTVRTLILIPRFVFSLSCLERRNPLHPTARRRAYVLCNILLINIPPDARILIVSDGVPVSSDFVREQYARFRPLDVLNLVRSLGRREFSLAEVYAQGGEALRRLRPGNRFVEAKIRQQLQRLRDLGFLECLGAGWYRAY